MSVQSATDDHATVRLSSRRRLLLPISLFAVLFVVYLATAARDVSGLSMDAWSANFASWRIVSTGDPTMGNLPVPELDDNAGRAMWVVLDADGNDVIGRAPGVIAAGVPAYWLAGVDSMTLWPGALTAAIVTAGAMTMMFLALRTRLTDRRAALATLVLGLTTPMWSVAANGVWPHTVTVLGIAGMAWAAAWGRWWLVGMFGGITLWGRLHAVVIVAILGVLVARRRRSWAILFKVGLVSASFLVLVCVWMKWMYGTWDPTASYDAAQFAGYAADNDVSVVNHLGFWVSPGRGILVWTPLLVLLAPSVVRGWRGLPDWTTSLVWSGVVYTLIQMTFNRFTGGDTSYGYRLGLEFLACATPAIAFSAHRMGRVARRLIGPVIGLQFLAIFVGASLDSFYIASAEAWTNNSFLFAAKNNPGLGVCVALSMVLGALGQRLWERSEAAARDVVRVPVAP